MTEPTSQERLLRDAILEVQRSAHEAGVREERARLRAAVVAAFGGECRDDDDTGICATHFEVMFVEGGCEDSPARVLALLDDPA